MIYVFPTVNGEKIQHTTDFKFDGKKTVITLHLTETTAKWLKSSFDPFEKVRIGAKIGDSDNDVFVISGVCGRISKIDSPLDSLPLIEVTYES